MPCSLASYISLRSKVNKRITVNVLSSFVLFRVKNPVWHKVKNAFALKEKNAYFRHWAA